MPQKPTHNLLDLLSDQNRTRPLAEVLRPQTLEDFVGQETVLGPNTPLRNLFAAKKLTSLIFWGPPGVGKTTLARLIANQGNAHFIELSAVNSGLKELREAIATAQENLRHSSQRTVIFIDEIHRYNKTQQDAMLPYVENGTILLMGATTENPSFQVIPALLSRLLLVRLHPLSEENIQTVIHRAVAYYGDLDLPPEAVTFITHYANGDARSALVLVENAQACAIHNPEAGRREVTVALLESLAQQNRLLYDRQGDEHYDHASAFQKSLRGSDPDAAIYWLAKMLAAGEDPRFIARRLIVTAAEDVGLARPGALAIAISAAEAVDRIGLPEGRIPLALATAYIAKAPKSNHAYMAIDKALSDITQQGKSYPVPTHLRDSHYKDAKTKYGHGEGYLYSHTHPGTPQTFLPEPLLGTRYLDPEAP